jgi:RNA-directed DNA polymerase
VDGVSLAAFEIDLKGNLYKIWNRMSSGAYFPPPVRLVEIPKDNNGGIRPLGIPTFEEKVAQRAIAMVLEAVYEQDFLSCSYGFRPGRSAHQALRQLSGAITVRRQHWVLDVDIRKYLDRDSYYTLAYEVWLKRSCCERMRLWRGPFLRPCLTWMALISPCLTRCHTACREMRIA